MPTNTPHQYFAYAHNIEGCLENGSFVRRSKYGLGQFTNGDFMGFIEDVPEGMVEVDRDLARCHIPECCR
jgi:hypothetical protein